MFKFTIFKFIKSSWIKFINPLPVINKSWIAIGVCTVHVKFFMILSYFWTNNFISWWLSYWRWKDFDTLIFRFPIFDIFNGFKILWALRKMIDNFFRWFLGCLFRLIIDKFIVLLWKWRRQRNGFHN